MAVNKNCSTSGVQPALLHAGCVVAVNQYRSGLYVQAVAVENPITVEDAGAAGPLISGDEFFAGFQRQFERERLKC